jgi:glycogen debranching enzyme
MAEALGHSTEVADLHAEIDHLRQVINASMWDNTAGFYFDRRADGSLSNVKTIGAFWALLAGITPPENMQRFVAHLDNPAEFKRPHRVPSLSADNPHYEPRGEYWCGGVWPPTNYMVLRGLTQAGYHALAHKIAFNHHSNVIQVFEKTGTVWENYAPESAAPGNIAAKEFVGWTGLSPVAVLFEYVFGLRPDVPANKLVWDVRLADAHGVNAYPFGENGLLDLQCAARTAITEKPVIEAKSNQPLTLEITWEGGRETRQL